MWFPARFSSTSSTNCSILAGIAVSKLPRRSRLRTRLNRCRKAGSISSRLMSRKVRRATWLKSTASGSLGSRPTRQPWMSNW
ncbi:hypothetical protein D3C80_1770990 [compost metagenome]